jgi:hypothetical protein
VTREIGADYFNNTESPYVKALQWITHEDPLQILPESTNFIQRYVLAYMYYATSVDRPWSSCTKATSNETDDCIFLKTISADGQDVAEIPWKRWLGNTSECDWAGISCNDNKQVLTIDLGKFSRLINLILEKPLSLIYCFNDIV